MHFKLGTVIAVCTVLILTVAACGTASNGNLFFVDSVNCPAVVPGSLNLDNAAGFSSLGIARRVAARETAAIRTFWRQRIISLSTRVAEPSATPEAMATWTVELARAHSEKVAFAACRRTVRRGQAPPTPISTLPY